MAERACAECGGDLPASGGSTQFLCRRCNASRREGRCFGCRKTFRPKSSNRRTFCSRDCAFKVASEGKARRASEKADREVSRFHPCLDCGICFDGHPLAPRCPECKAEHRLSRARAHYHHVVAPRLGVNKSERPCKRCGVVFSPVGSNRRNWCSRRCQKRATKGGVGKSAQSRARHFGVERETLDPLKVFERDGWRCQVCGCSTPKKLRGTTHARAPELDHRVPMARGGAHNYANVQTACRTCNAQKGGVHVVGQLPLWNQPLGRGIRFSGTLAGQNRSEAKNGPIHIAGGG